MTDKSSSLWSETASPSAQFLALDVDSTTDVVVIGGGITGLTTALMLAMDGKRVVLVEAHRIGSGVSHRSTAQLTEAVDARYTTIEKDFGKAGARLVAESSRAAIERVASLITTFSISCDFMRRPAYLFTEDREDVAMLGEEHEAARRAGLDTSLLELAPLPFATVAALHFPNQAQVHIVRYLQGLTKAARELGVAIHENSRVVTIDDGDDCNVHLEGGVIIRTKKVVVATHAPLNRVFLQTKIHAYRSYVLAFAEVAIADGLFFDTRDPYHYFSSFGIDGVPYLVVGGEDHKTGAEGATDDRFAVLGSWVKERMGATRPSHHWSAQVEEPVDGLPYIGRNSLSENVYVATGFGGNGITFGTIAAEVITGLVGGRNSSWAELYAATRVKPLAAAGTYARENIDFPMHLVSDRLAPVEARSLGEIAPGEGKSIRVHGERLAVYRDGKGSLHAVSSVCTHLGCLVKFNAAETSWDCPCHGSRFGVDGEVLDGPAVKPLAQRSLGGDETSPEVVEPRWSGVTGLPQSTGGVLGAAGGRLPG